MKSYFEFHAIDGRGEDLLGSAIHRLIRDALGFKIEGKLLEIGCGTRPWADILSVNGSSAVVDPSMAALRRLSLCAFRICALSEALPFGSGIFKTVFCKHLIHHLAGTCARESDEVLGDLLG